MSSHYKDFPPGLPTLRGHKERGDVGMIAFAFGSFQSDLMRKYCVEAFAWMNGDRAYETVKG